MSNYPQLSAWVSVALRSGLAIPAHPLALDRHRRFDERRQRAVTRYYHASGVGGVAVGVHTTQFEIRLPEHALYEPVLRSAVDVVRECDSNQSRQTVLIAGISGGTSQAIVEARLARDLGYHIGLLSLGALRDAPLDEMVRHIDTVARTIPIMGFYLQPAVGGVALPYEFWTRLAEIPNIVAIKIAPFNRYATLDVVRAIADSGRADEIALYTGNDDNIVADLVTEFDTGSNANPIRIVGGLLGQWACWTSKAVALLSECHQAARARAIPMELLARGAQLTAANAAVFDVVNRFRGSVAGVNEILCRQGLLASSLCLDPHSDLSPGQAKAIDDVCKRYPHLTDDAFVNEHRDRWLDL
ncbi:MAG: dihydrodipicolinate synthase family protein [bacterium]|nr:dihydrodipicolinate synthase family protein [Candidatus Kapabacteria bacterium]